MDHPEFLGSVCYNTDWIWLKNINILNGLYFYNAKFSGHKSKGFLFLISGLKCIDYKCVKILKHYLYENNYYTNTNYKDFLKTIFIIKYFWMCIIGDTVLVDE